jgi:hypothetical protein
MLREEEEREEDTSTAPAEEKRKIDRLVSNPQLSLTPTVSRRL